MEENKVEETVPVMEEEVEEAPKWEILPWNKNDSYIPTEYQLIDYQNSWKQCYCGRKTRFNDNYCPSCGQKLGVPEFE